MIFLLYKIICKYINDILYQDSEDTKNGNKRNNAYINKKNIALIIILLLYIVSNNIDSEYLSNSLIFSKTKNYDYFTKYFKNNSYIINNKTKTKNIALINEIVYLYDIRKQINIFKDANYENINNMNLKRFEKVIHPKISLILTIYNQEKFILRIYSCILNQSLTNIEIVIIDDKSTDNSIFLVEKLMEFDKRITFIKNKLNKGQFYSRNQGVLLSKGKYVLIVDPDDFLLNNILIKSFKAAKKFKLDIIQFYHVMGNFSLNHLYIINKKSKSIQTLKTKTIFFNNPTRYLWDKLIKRNIFIKSIYFMHEKYRKERFIIHNDEIVCFGIFKTADSYGQIDDVGYFYNRNISNSTTTKNFLPENLNGRFHCIFTIMKYYYEQSSNSSYEKINGGYTFFTYRIIRRYEDKIIYLTEGFDFIIDVINIYLKSKYYDENQKKLLKKFKSKISQQKLKFKQSKKL